MRINNAIRIPKVRLIDQDHKQVGIVDRDSALQMAMDVGLDLVEISPDSDPPVCRIMDYGKYVYEQKRKIRESRKKSHQHSSTLKEIRIRPETDKHDLDIKVKHAHEFLEKGHKVQFTMQFRGRQLLHQEQAQAMLDYVIEQTQDVSNLEQPGMMANRRMILVLVPK